MEGEATAGTAGTAVLRRINLTVHDGEFMVLVGPSGCGKSTLLRLIAGLEPITAGTIYVDDRRINDLPPKQRDIAMVFQSYALYPHMTVYDNLAFGLRRSGQVEAKATKPSQRRLVDPALTALTRPLTPAWRYWSSRERWIDQRVQQVAQMLQIEPLLRRLPRQLSGGQKQRVALGRAMARQPQVFLMDEPLSNLDAKLRTETRAQIVNLQRTLGTTTLYVTHDQTEAMTMGDRIAVLNGGQIQQIATPLDLYTRPANRFVAQFIGSPPMNLVPVQVQTSRLIVHPQFCLTLPDCWETLLTRYQGKSVILGIRPEHLSLGAAAPRNIPVQVQRVEALGSETYLTVHVQDSTDLLQARVDPDCRIVPGEDLWLSVTLDKLHLFDGDTGVALN
ncbi:MAG: ATP-binding cassette domain-containing protein [Kaiparowitsia implicata GSE-PSE-MK54-09C]|nr:ATP-binding cassette domain-containing protein [Kaiparowitsia implicata GSE-PSE-MK54-09C]